MNKAKRILLVDDDPDFVDAIRSIVDEAGYAVDVAYDGQQGLAKIRAGQFDLVVLDVMMPVLNGHNVTKELKSNPATKDIPIILLTAVAERVTSSSYTHRDMLESDAEDYLAKPVEPELLLERINYWLS